MLERVLTNTLVGYIVGVDGDGGTKMSEKKEDRSVSCDCCHRTKERTEAEQRKLIHRLNRIEGQIRGIRGMVEKSAYCPDILTQSAAATAAIQAFNRELLASHIRTCVVKDIRAGKGEIVDELTGLLQKLMK